ncbi:MAG: glutamate 5-kinase, partial [Candidatus Firestonebacteria bacterium]
MHRLSDIVANNCGRIVVKAGSNLLASKAAGINLARIEAIARALCYLQDKGKSVVLVSSGAQAAGVAALRLKEKPKSMADKQAVAAVGQPLLMEAYENAFRKHGKHIAQILLTKDDLSNKARFFNAKNTFSALLDRGIIPVVNENDTVAVEEIKVGDNDNLSAMVANLVEADLLVILTDIDGLYTDDPSTDPDAVLIPLVEKIDARIEKAAKKTNSELATGGMQTKIQAAKRCVSSGIAVVICNGTRPEILQDIFDGKFRGTLFLPAKTLLTNKKKWMAFVAHPKGFVVVDDGARDALVKKQKSLLPSGIKDAGGDFKAGDTISVRDLTGAEVARGEAAYSKEDVLKVKGCKASEAAKVLNCSGG